MAYPSVFTDPNNPRGGEQARSYDDLLRKGYTKDQALSMATGGPYIPLPTQENTSVVKGSSNSKAGSYTGGGSTSSSKSSKTKTGFDIEKEAKRLKEEAKKQKEAQEKAARERIGKAWDPIHSELDRQLGLMPTRQAEYEAEIGRLSEDQRASVEAERAKSKATLEASRGQVTEQAQSSLRDLEGDIRNQLKAKVNMLGAASNSSAADEVSEAVMREGLKGRAKILSTRDQAYGQLDQKAVEIDNLAGEQINKVEEWKKSTLFQIGQDFADKMDALQREKANASAEEARAIDDRITGLEQGFFTTLQNLDQQVLSYKSSIATWQMQRQAELEDYGTKLAMSAKYQGLADDAKKYEEANAIFKESISLGMNAQEAQLRAFNQTGVDPLKGLELTQDMIDKIKREAGNNTLFTQDALGNPVYVDRSNPAGGYTQIPAAGQSSAGAAPSGDGGLFGSILKAISGN